MIITIVLTILIAAYSVFVIVKYFKDRNKAKKNDTPQGCYSCPAMKAGRCPSHKDCKGHNK